MKRIIIFLLAIATMLNLIGCGNKKIFDENYTFDYAIVELPDY